MDFCVFVFLVFQIHRLTGHTIKPAQWKEIALSNFSIINTSPKDLVINETGTIDIFWEYEVSLVYVIKYDAYLVDDDSSEKTLVGTRMLTDNHFLQDIAEKDVKIDEMTKNFLQLTITNNKYNRRKLILEFTLMNERRRVLIKEAEVGVLTIIQKPTLTCEEAKLVDMDIFSIICQGKSYPEHVISYEITPEPIWHYKKVGTAFVAGAYLSEILITMSVKDMAVRRHILKLKAYSNDSTENFYKEINVQINTSGLSFYTKNVIIKILVLIIAGIFVILTLLLIIIYLAKLIRQGRSHKYNVVASEKECDKIESLHVMTSV